MEDDFADMVKIYSYLCGITRESPCYCEFVSICFNFYRDKDRDKFHEALEKLKESSNV